MLDSQKEVSDSACGKGARTTETSCFDGISTTGAAGVWKLLDASPRPWEVHSCCGC